MPSRGPDPIDLFYSEWARETIKLGELDKGTLACIDRLVELRERGRTLGHEVAIPATSRELAQMIAMRQGTVFWDRTPAEPVP